MTAGEVWYEAARGRTEGADVVIMSDALPLKGSAP